MNTMHSRRPRAAGLAGAVLAAALVLTGCSGTTDSSNASTSASDSTDSLLPASEGKTHYPLTLKTPFGESSLEKRPERVVALSADGIDGELVVALGATPVFAPKNVMQPYNPTSITDNIETIDEWDYDTFPYEKIAASNPDVIVAHQGDLTQEQYDKLVEIAPVRTGSEDAAKAKTAPWQDSIKLIGTALDLSGKADEVVENNTKYFESMIEKYPNIKGKTLTYAAFFGSRGGTMMLSTEGSTYWNAFERLGFTLPKNADKFTDSISVSDEQIGLLDADVMLISYPVGDSASNKEAIKSFRDNKLVQAVPVVKYGRYVELLEEDGTYKEGGTLETASWALAQNGPLSAPWAIDAVLPLLSDKIG